REKRSVLDRIPAPVASPTEHGVSPMRAKKNADGLEAPGDHGPFASEVNPLFAGIARQQGSQRKGKRNGKTRVSRVEIRRMDDHLRVLQERIEAVSIHADERFQYAAGTHVGESFEGAFDEIVQREKENLDAGQNHANIRHQFAILMTVGDEYRNDVNSEEEAPKQQRTLLAGPQSGNFIERGEIAIAVGNHVSLREVVAEEQIFEAERADEDQHASGDARLACALNQQRMPRDDGGNAPHERIH